MAATILKIQTGEFGLSLTDPGVAVDLATLAGYTDFSCQLTSGAITASQNIDTEDVPATFCDVATENLVPQTSSYVVAISMLQDADIASGLAQFCYDNDATEVWFYLGLATASSPKAIGSLYISPTDFGGEAKIVLTSDQSWPIIGKPEIEFGITADA